MQVLPHAPINYWASASEIGLQETRVGVRWVGRMVDGFGIPSDIERGWNCYTLRDELLKSKG